MKTLFMPSTNTSTNGVSLGNAGDDVRVFRVLIGTPVSAGNIWFYNVTNAVGSSTSNIAAKVTLPSFSTTNINPGLYMLDFGPEGLLLNDGGTVTIDQTMNVTVMWDLNDDSQS